MRKTNWKWLQSCRWLRDSTRPLHAVAQWSLVLVSLHLIFHLISLTGRHVSISHPVDTKLTPSLSACLFLLLTVGLLHSLAGRLLNDIQVGRRFIKLCSDFRTFTIHHLSLFRTLSSQNQDLHFLIFFVLFC